MLFAIRQHNYCYFAPVRGAPEARGPRHMPLLPYRLTRHWLSRQENRTEYHRGSIRRDWCQARRTKRFFKHVSRLPRLPCVSGGIINTLSQQLVAVTVTQTERADNRSKHEEVGGAVQRCYLYVHCTASYVDAPVWRR